MTHAGIPKLEQHAYLRWIRFYLDFCEKYSHPPRVRTSISPFLAKLGSKKQTEAACRQAAEAVDLLLSAKMVRKSGQSRMPPTGRDEKTTSKNAEAPAQLQSVAEQSRNSSTGAKQNSPDNPQVPVSEQVPRIEEGGPGRTSGPGHSWEQEFRDLEGEIKMRNYSDKTHDAYRHWARKLQAFTRSKPPGELNDTDVKAFLTDLAVRERVAASTQNQAFNALRFFHRHVLKREFGQIEGVTRAKRRPYIPVVLTQKEVESVLRKIPAPFRLPVSLIYGCGLRLDECLELRLQCFNLGAGLLTIHDGKGQKDRSVPLPQCMLSQIEEQIGEVKLLLKKDLQIEKFAGTFLPRQLGKKYRSAAKQVAWQWMFPATSLTRVDGTDELRRYHYYDSQVQVAVKKAADASGVTKRVTPHTFRHTYGSHLLLAGYDVPTIQKLMGHSDIKTTMIYLQTVPPMKAKEAKSPLDLWDEPL